MSQIMHGIRIVEVAEHTFVPAASEILADWGAEVIKIEHHERGDAARGLDSSGTASYGSSVHLLVEHSNRGKQSLGLNLAVPDGQAILHRLVASADVFITNKLPSVAAKLGIDVDGIRAQNPDIVYVRGSGYGAKGPDADAGGYDFLSFWARGGSADPSRVGATPPTASPGPAYGDNIGAMTIAGGVCAALLHRERTGETHVVDLSLLATGMWAMASAIGLSLPSGERFDAQVLVNGGPTTNPLAGAYQTADDRYLAFSMLEGFQYWPEFCDRVSHPEWVADPQFATASDFRTNANAGRDLVREVIASKALAHWKELFRGMKGQWSPDQDTIEVTLDPQTEANGYLQEVQAADGQGFRMVSTPVQLDGSPGTARRGPPHNEHGDAILTEQLGLDWGTAIDLKLRGVVT